MQSRINTMLLFFTIHYYKFIEMGKHRQDDDFSDDYSNQSNQEEQKVQIRKPKIERIDKFKIFKKIIINISMTQYPVVSEVAEALNWKIQESNDAGDWDVYWTDFAIDPDILIKMHLFQKINHYPGMHVIARKNLLGLNLMSLKNKFPDQYNFFPLTWMLPMQYAQFRTYYETKPKGKARTYIAKPQADCQGRGIFLTRKIEDLENGKHYVVQRYLARPFLIEGLKFDLRIYVLLCGTNPLRLYMYNEGLGRLATEQYVEPTTSNLEKQYMHLTNYAINKNNPKFIFNNSSSNMGIGHKRSLSCIFKQLEAMGLNISELKAKINDVAIKTLICGLPHMSHQYRCSQPEDYSGSMCFHLLGLDIMLNNKGQPVLLEVNHTPSFTTDTPLDHKIKFNLIKDTLKLMNINPQTKTQLFNKTKEYNKQRLISGKRHIYEGQQRQKAIKQAQNLRDEYEDKNLGGFERIFPINDKQKMQKYNEIIDTANKIYFEENGSIRMKQIQKQNKKILKSNYKQNKLQQQQMNFEKDNRISATPFIDNGSEVILKISNEQYEITSQDQKQILSRSQNTISRSNYLQNNLSKIYEQNNKQTNKQHNDIIIKMQSRRQQTASVQLNYIQNNSNIINDQKSPSIRKIGPRVQFTTQKQQNINTQIISRRKQRMKSTILNKKNVKNKQINKEIINKMIGQPIKITTIHRINSTSMQQQIENKKDDKKYIPYSRQKITFKNGKIYQIIPQNINQKKNATPGKFIMPKIINFNFDCDKPIQLPNNPYRKNSLFYQNQ